MRIPMPTSSTRFVYDWREIRRLDGSLALRPEIPVLVQGRDGFVPRYFLLDSGADLSMAPYEGCRQIGLRWQEGIPTTLRGISQRKTCWVQGRIHWVDILVSDANLILHIPMVFARGKAPFVLGREGFFDVFDVSFAKNRRRIVLEQVIQQSREGASNVPH